jgi:hypothetical protein
MTSKAFIAIAESSRFASWFVPGLNGRDFFLSYGFEAPDLKDYEVSSYWMAGGYAARFQRAGLAGNLTAPGQEWLSSIDESLLGRRIVTGSLSAMPEGVTLWAKPAEAKIDAMIAGRYTKDEVEKIFASENLPSHTNFQWTEDILRINHEHRFYVCDETIVTGSPYLIDGVVYHQDIESPRYDEAKKYAGYALKELGENRPPAFTLDVGLNEITDQWLIVEANPAWSSGIYGSDPAKVIDVLDVACNGHDKRWKWIPADYLVRKALIAPKVRISDNDNLSPGIFRYSA